MLLAEQAHPRPATTACARLSLVDPTYLECRGTQRTEAPGTTLQDLSESHSNFGVLNLPKRRKQHSPSARTAKDEQPAALVVPCLNAKPPRRRRIVHCCHVIGIGPDGTTPRFSCNSGFQR